MVERQLPKLHTRVRFPSPAAFAVIALHTQIASGAEAGKAKAKSKTEYIRYIPGADPAAATRAFDAKWKAIFGCVGSLET
jgi:hypothetical protein